MRQFARPLALLVGIIVFTAGTAVALVGGVRLGTALYRAGVSASVCGTLTWLSYLLGHNTLSEAIESGDDQKEGENRQ